MFCVCIFGFVKKQAIQPAKAQKIVEIGIDAIRHRGPDGEGSWLSLCGLAAFGHTRLAIIDVESGQQPMASNCGRYVIVFNGEIYNYVELRSEIGLSNFSTLSDTEVIIEAFKVWGENCVEKLRGMFAFAIWDQKNQSLFLARDRFGIKPLYFHENDDGLYFSSELKGVLPFCGQSRLIVLLSPTI